MTTQQNKLLRLNWVKSVTLPKNDELRLVLVDLPVTLHPLIDEYLTVKERQDLLIRYGWIVKVGNYCYSANPIRMNKELNEWLKNASFMMDVTVHMKLSNTGENYL